MEQDNITTTMNLDSNFMVEIPLKEEYSEIILNEDSIGCYTDVSKLDNNQAGAGVVINECNGVIEEAIHLGEHATVFQAEVFAVGRVAYHLIHAKTKNENIVVNCDSQAAIIALDSTQ